MNAWVYVPRYPHLLNKYLNIHQPLLGGAQRPEDYKALVQIKVHRIALSPLFETEVFNLDYIYRKATHKKLDIQDTDALDRFINPRRLVFFGQESQEFFIGQTVWRFGFADQTVVFVRYLEDADDRTVAHKIIGEDATGIYGEYYAEAGRSHLLRKLVLSGGGYQITDSYTLDDYYQMKPQIDLRSTVTDLRVATSQPTHALVSVDSFE